MILNAYSFTFYGPVAGAKYNVGLVCADDMRQYRPDREEVIGDNDKGSKNVEEDFFTREKEKIE